jgi:rhodanese-related sulfurtransferase
VTHVKSQFCPILANMKNAISIRTLGTHTLTLGILCVHVACNKPTDPTHGNNAFVVEPQDKAPGNIAAGQEAPQPHVAFKQLNVDDVQAMLDSKAVVAVDANGKDTRAEIGIVPGAVLLSNYRTFEMSELPPDKATRLVFYCGSETCTAAPKAAARAQEAGYINASVMPAGIRGWAKAGKPTQKI